MSLCKLKSEGSWTRAFGQRFEYQVTTDQATAKLHNAADGHADHVKVHVARLRWAVNLRWGYMTGLFVLAFVLPSPLQKPLLILAAFYGVIGVIFWAWGRRKSHEQTSDGISLLANLQIATDLLMLAWMLLLTGGMMNPLVVFVLFHLALASTLLSRKAAYLQCAWASLLYIILAFVQWRFPSWEYVAAIPGFGVHPLSYQGAWEYLFTVVVIGYFFLTVFFTNAILARLRKINSNLVEANRELAGLDLAKSRFLRVSSHQLRSPLAAIHSLLSAVQEAGGFNSRQYDLIRKIQARSEDAMALVDEMMLLSTIKENASETKQMAKVNVDATVAAVAGTFGNEAINKKLTLKVASDSKAMVWAWEDALETVLEHLISNALKYTEIGKEVDVTAREDGQRVRITVADQGIGVPSEQQDRLFHEFFRATNARQVAGGTGMGLAIVKAIVERLGGQIEIQSAQGRGTTVTVMLPAATDDEVAADSVVTFSEGYNGKTVT